MVGNSILVSWATPVGLVGQLQIEKKVNNSASFVVLFVSYQFFCVSYHVYLLAFSGHVGYCQNP